MGKKKEKKEIAPIAAFYRRILAVNLKITRKRLKLKQEKMAERGNISKNQVSNIEREKVNVGLDILAALADGLDITASELLDPEWPRKVPLRFPAEDDEG